MSECYPEPSPPGSPRIYNINLDTFTPVQHFIIENSDIYKRRNTKNNNDNKSKTVNKLNIDNKVTKEVTLDNKNNQ